MVYPRLLMESLFSIGSSKISLIWSMILLTIFSFSLINRPFFFKLFDFFFCHFLFVYPLRCFYNLFPLSFWDKKAKIFPTCFGLSLKFSLVASVVIFLFKILCHLWQNLLFYFYLNYQSLDYLKWVETLYWNFHILYDMIHCLKF